MRKAKEKADRWCGGYLRSCGGEELEESIGKRNTEENCNKTKPFQVVSPKWINFLTKL